MFYKSQSDELFIVPVLKDIRDHHQPLEIAHLQKYGTETTLCDQTSASAIGLYPIFLAISGLAGSALNSPKL
jgi:hypothetical protein